MYSDTTLHPGAKVDMRPVQVVSRNGRVDDNEHYVSGIHDIEEDGTLLLEMPMRGGKVVLLPMGVRYELVFTMDRKLLKAEAEMINRTRKGGFSLVCARLTSPVEKFQRREYYRLNVTVPISFISLDERAGDLSGMAEIRQLIEGRNDLTIGDGTIVNISGGGLRFITDTDLGEAEYIFMRFAVDVAGQSRTIALIGQIVGSGLTEDRKHKAYRVQILFKDSRLQEIIIRFIFEEERRIRRKVMGG